MIVGFVLLHFLVCFKLPFTSLQFTEPVITESHSFMLHHMFEIFFGKLESFGADDALVSLMLFEISRFFVFLSITLCFISVNSFQFWDLQGHTFCDFVRHIQPDRLQGILRRTLVASQLPQRVKWRIALVARKTKVCAIIGSHHCSNLSSDLSETGVKVCAQSLTSAGNILPLCSCLFVVDWIFILSTVFIRKLHPSTFIALECFPSDKTLQYLESLVIVNSSYFHLFPKMFTPDSFLKILKTGHQGVTRQFCHYLIPKKG